MFTGILELYRVKDWAKNLGISIIGLTTAFSLTSNLFLFFLGLFQVSLIFSFAYSLDDLNDHIVEKEDNFIGKLIKKLKIPRKFAFILCVLPLTLSFYIATKNFSINYLISYLTLIIISSLYSFPKVRLGDIPFVDVFCNVIFFSCIFLSSYFFINSELTGKAYFFLIWTVIYVFSLEILHQLSHFKKDKISTVRFLGKGNSLKIFKLSILIQFFVGIIFFIGLKELLAFSLVMMSASLLRFFHVYKLNEKANFEKLRNRMGGFLEGGIYFILLALGV